MIDLRTTSRAAAFALLLAIPSIASVAHAQSYDAPDEDATFSDGVAIGEWRFRPSIELRTLGEYRRRPFDTGGATIVDDTSVGTAARDPVKDQGYVIQRSRLGLTADRGMFRLALQIQDARAWGEVPPSRVDRRDSLPGTAPHLAYGELHGRGEHSSFLRLGRQEIRWGDGRMLSESDWSPTGRSLDALRGMVVVGDVDLDAFASMLTPPGAEPPELRRGSQGRAEGTGAQLYGLRAAWHVSPLLHIEWNNLGRIVRDPVDGTTAPSDLGASGLRVSGDFKRISYAAEGTYEVGRKAIVATTEQIRAYAGAARVELTTGLPGKLAIGAQGAYASGRKHNGADPSGDTDTRFDPMLADVHDNHGPMGAYAWSNVIEGAGLLRFTPIAESRVTLAWRYVMLAEPTDTWWSASLVPIGRDGNNSDSKLGQELDAGIDYTPWAPLRIAAGYGAFLTGGGARNILESSGRGRPDVQHYGYLQLTLRAP